MYRIAKEKRKNL